MKLTTMIKTAVAVVAMGGHRDLCGTGRVGCLSHHRKTWQ